MSSRDKVLYGFELKANDDDSYSLSHWLGKDIQELQKIKREKKDDLLSINKAYNEGQITFNDYKKTHTKILTHITQIDIALRRK